MTLSTQELTAIRPVICCSCSQQWGVLGHEVLLGASPVEDMDLVVHLNRR